MLRTVELYKIRMRRNERMEKKIKRDGLTTWDLCRFSSEITAESADALLDNQTRETEISQLQQKISVLSADLASSRDSGAADEIAKLATKLIVKQVK